MPPPRFQFRLRTLLLLIAVIPIAIVVYNYTAGGVWWVGRGNVAVEFIVTDAHSGRPIPAANVAVLELDRPPNVAGNYLFTLQTDDHGIVVATKPGMASGTDHDSPFLTDTYGIDIPSWRVKASAPGYDEYDLPYIGDDGGRPRRTEYLGGAKYRLVVPIRLNKPASP